MTFYNSNFKLELVSWEAVGSKRSANASRPPEVTCLQKLMYFAGLHLGDCTPERKYIVLHMMSYCPLTRRQWMVLISVFLCHFLSCGIGYALGIYYLPIIEVFQMSYGVTAWISSLTIASLCLGCK